MEELTTNTNTNPNPSTNLNNDEPNGGSFYKSGFQAAVSDVEMISLQVATYTSLKDLLPSSLSSPQASVTSPSANNSGWNEIPIRNPLVKHAALAYLQPMSSATPETGEKGLLGRLRDGCCGRRSRWWQCECLSWVNDVVVSCVREVFCWEGGRRRRREDFDDDEEDDEKVD